MSRVVVVGAGLAGAAVARSLTLRGRAVTVWDADGPCGGASGVPVGVFAPHVSVDGALFSQVVWAGVQASWRTLCKPPYVQDGIRLSGVVQVLTKNKLVGPHPALSECTTLATETQRITLGLPGNQGAWWHSVGGWVVPHVWVNSMLREAGVTVCKGQVASLVRQGNLWLLLDAMGGELDRTGQCVLAAGIGTRALLTPLLSNLGADTRRLLLQPLRGQVSGGTMPAAFAAADVFAVNGAGNLALDVPYAGHRTWWVGSTFERDIASTLDRCDADGANWQRLALLAPRFRQAVACPGLHEASGVTLHWAGVRCASRDRLPLVGAVHPALPGLLLCTAFGARGLALAVLAAELLSAQLHGESLPVTPMLARLMRADRWML